MVKLRTFIKTDFDSLNYILPEEQARFTGDIDHCINKRKDLESNTKHVISLLYNNLIVGFFVLDTSDDKLKLTNNKDSILIRSFSVNPNFQGKGIGKQSMILVSDFVKKNYSGINEIVLSVNMKNKSAYHLYLKSSFIDNGKTIDGVMGSQHVLYKKI